MRPSLKARTSMKTRFFHQATLATEREREIRNVRGRARGVLLSHSKGLLAASYGITVCIRVYFGSHREPALPLQKIITCIRVGFHPSPSAIIAHFLGIPWIFPILLFPSADYSSYSKLLPPLSSPNRTDTQLIKSRRSKRIDPIKAN